MATVGRCGGADIGGDRARLGNHERPTDHLVDLHPRRGRPQRAARHRPGQFPPRHTGQTGAPTGLPGGPATGGAAAVIDVTEANIQSEVLERSMTTPVSWSSSARPATRTATSSPRCWSGWPPRAAARGCSPGSTSRTTRGSPRCSGSRASPWSTRSSAGRPIDAFPGVIPEPQLRQWLARRPQGRWRQRGRAGGPAPRRGRRRPDERRPGRRRAGVPQDPRRVPGGRRGRGRPGPGRAGPPGRRRRPAAPRSPPPQANPDDVDAQLLAADIEVLSGHGRAGVRPAGRAGPAHRR